MVGGIFNWYLKMSRLFKFIICCVFIGVLVIIIVCVSVTYVQKNVPVSTIPIWQEVYFFHYARERNFTAIEIKMGEKLNETINPKFPWKLMIHGWTTNPWATGWFDIAKVEYFHKGEYNILYIDWSIPAHQTYVETVKSIPDVGKYIGKFVIHLRENGVSLDDIHLMGHSVGAHLAGEAGKYVRDNAEKVGRVTGLDPASNGYESSAPFNHDIKILVPERLRMGKDDAKMVDIIHTDPTHYGMVTNTGTCDFYSNGFMAVQPGCVKNDKYEHVICSHMISMDYFCESINSSGFIAKQCGNYSEYLEGRCSNNPEAIMGENISPNASGVYYLTTNAEAPYARNNRI